MNRVSERAQHRPYATKRAGIAHATDHALDLDRTASMADEGGRAGATMDLRDQLADTRVVRRQRRPLSARDSLLLGVAGFAAGLLAAFLWRRRVRTE